MASKRKIEKVLAEIDERLAFMREALEEERLQRAIEENRYFNWDLEVEDLMEQ